MLKRPKTPLSAYDRAIRYLAARSHSRRELALKLARNHQDEEVEAALKKAAARGYLDDRQFAVQRAVLSRLHKDWGDRRIALDLEQHGIDEVAIRQALNAAAAERSESDALQRNIARWVKSKGVPDSLEQLKKLHDRCLRMGYPPAAIRHKLAPYFRMMSLTEDPQDSGGDEGTGVRP